MSVYSHPHKVNKEIWRIRGSSNASTDAALETGEACRVLENSLRVYGREMYVEAQLKAIIYGSTNSSLTNSIISPKEKNIYFNQTLNKFYPFSS